MRGSVNLCRVTIMTHSSRLAVSVKVSQIQLYSASIQWMISIPLFPDKRLNFCVYAMCRLSSTKKNGIASIHVASGKEKRIFSVCL